MTFLTMSSDSTSSIAFFRPFSKFWRKHKICLEQSKQYTSNAFNLQITNVCFVENEEFLVIIWKFSKFLVIACGCIAWNLLSALVDYRVILFFSLYKIVNNELTPINCAFNLMLLDTLLQFIINSDFRNTGDIFLFPQDS